jgi:aminoacrylate hydrolase
VGDLASTRFATSIDGTVPYAPVPSGELYYETDGNGPPLLLAGGLGGLASFWQPQLAHFRTRFTVVTYDHRGSGRSTRSPPPYSIARMAEDAIALMDHIELDSVRFVGHSTGGAVGQWLAARFPRRVARLVLSATWTHADPYLRRLFTLRRDLVNQRDTDFYTRLTTLLLYRPEWIVAHDAELPEQQPLLEPLDRAIIASKIDALLAFDGRDALAAISCPTLVVSARDDALVPSYFSLALTRAIPNAQLASLDSGGHYYPISCATEFAGVVAPFLETANTSPHCNPGA